MRLDHRAKRRARAARCQRAGVAVGNEGRAGLSGVEQRADRVGHRTVGLALLLMEPARLRLGAGGDRFRRRGAHHDGEYLIERLAQVHGRGPRRAEALGDRVQRLAQLCRARRMGRHPRRLRREPHLVMRLSYTS